MIPPGASLHPGRRQRRAATAACTSTRRRRSHGRRRRRAEEASSAYARRPTARRRSTAPPIRTQPQGTFCTAHVFQQIPGQNRIFMGWYSQGTQVVDFVEQRRRHVRFSRAPAASSPRTPTPGSRTIFKLETQRRRHRHLLRRDRRLPLAERGPQRDRHLQGDAAPGAAARSVDGTGDAARATAASGRCAQKISGTKAKDKLLGTIGGDRIKGGKRQRPDQGPRGRRLRQRRRRATTGSRARRADDRVKGGRRGDRLSGGAGNDKLRDRSGGRDRLSGGGGRDRLRSAAAAPTWCAAAAARTRPSSTRTTRCAAARRCAADDERADPGTRGGGRADRACVEGSGVSASPSSRPRV